jgi:D-threo-aldose 1-dehydrogenase
MTDRRSFLSAASFGAAALGATALAGRGASAQTPTVSAPAPLPRNEPGQGRWRPPQRIGMGGVALGNGLKIVTSEADALGAMQAAWEGGVRLFDTSPWYGLGLSERRMGFFLQSKLRDGFTLCTKVGRVLDPDPKMGLRDDVGAWRNAPPFRYRYDYTADGTRRSVEDSLQRLGLSQIDVVYIHDLSPDNEDLGDKWREQFEIARTGAMPALVRMKEEGLIKAWGLGVNRPGPILATLEVAEPDIFLAATQYSLLDHAQALKDIFPACAAKGVSIMVGAPLNAGFLAGRNRFNYGAEVPTAMRQKRERLQEVARKHETDLRIAALHFLDANPTVCASIPGARNAQQARQNADALRTPVPAAFWAELKERKLIAEGAPVPGGG